jgi:integrase
MPLTLEAKKTSRPHHVLLRFSYSCRDRKYLSTGVVIPREDFNASSLEKPVLKSNPKHSHFNREIAAVYSKIMAIKSQLILESKEPTASLLFSIYQNTKVMEVAEEKDPLMKELFEEYLSSKKYAAATTKLFATLFDQFNSFFKDLKASELDLHAWNKFRTHLETTRSANTVCIRLAKLRAAIKFLKVKRGYEIPVAVFPLPKEEIKKPALDFDSFEKIVQFQPPTEALERIKDLCLFQCYTGLRISDLKRLGRQHIKNEKGVQFISMKTYKTNKSVVIPMKEALEILNKYDYQLPIVKEQYYNRELKRLLILADADKIIEWEAYDENGTKVFKKELLSENFSNHCCSRTAINYFFNLRFTPNQVADIVGKSLDTIMTYYYAKSSKSEILQRFRNLGGQEG